MAVGRHLEYLNFSKLYRVAYTGFETSILKLCKYIENNYAPKIARWVLWLPNYRGIMISNV